MARAIAVLSGSTAALLHLPVGHLGQRLVILWRATSHQGPRHYHPERHYMRGPGPAWQAKYGQQSGGQADQQAS
jgi:hypothetical protein